MQFPQTICIVLLHSRHLLPLILAMLPQHHMQLARVEAPILL
jgi:hypothetical protein